jgi:hypothetical protein
LLETACANERIIQRREIVGLLREKRANRIELAKRHAKHQRARQEAFALEQVQQSDGA